MFSFFLMSVKRNEFFERYIFLVLYGSHIKLYQTKHMDYSLHLFKLNCLTHIISSTERKIDMFYSRKTETKHTQMYQD